MSVGSHADVNGNLTITAPCGSCAGSGQWTDADLFLDYGGPYIPLGTPMLEEIGDNGTGGCGANGGGIHLPSRGMDVEISSYYNSNSSYNGPFGYGHTLTTNIFLRTSLTTPTEVEIVRGNGQVVHYRDDGTGKYKSQTKGVLNTLEQDVANGLWIEKTLDGRVMAFPLDFKGKAVPISWAEDAVGNRHTFHYIGGRLASLEDASSREVQFQYVSSGLSAPAPSQLLNTITDWAGRVTTFTYDTSSVEDKPLLIAVTAPAGCQTQYDYDEYGRMTGYQDANGYVTTYSYDEYGNEYHVTGRTVTGVGETHYEYDGDVTAMIDPYGAVATHTLDANGRLAIWQGPSGNEYILFRNSQGQEIQRVDNDGQSWLTFYNSEGVPVGMTNALMQTTTITRDDFQNPTAIAHWDGGVEYMEWFEEARLLHVYTDELNHSTEYGYDAYGQLTAETNAVGKTTLYAYDGYGNRTGMQDWLGNTTYYTPDAAGNVAAMMNPLGNTWTYTYDHQNRLLTTRDPLNRVTTMVYDGVGNLVTSFDEWGYGTYYTYNVWDRATTMTNALGQVTTMLYDDVGRPAVTIDPMGHVTGTAYDLAGRPIAVTDPLGHITTSIYDAVGNVIESINYLGYSTYYSHDDIGRVTAVTDPLNHTDSTEYDVIVAPGVTGVSATDAVGNTTWTLYDLKDQAIASIDQYGNRTTTTYDGVGRVTAIENPEHETTVTTYDLVDGFGRLQMRVEDADNNVTTTTYDAAGRAIITLNPGNEFNGTVYDDVNRVVATVDPNLNRTTTTYDLFDGTYWNSTTEDPQHNVTTTVYDALHRAIATVNPRAERSTTVYDPAGRAIAQVNDIDGVLSTTATNYDSANRVVASIDPLGNRTTTVYDVYYSGYPATETIDPLSNVTTTVMDEVGRHIRTIDPSGAITGTQYDAADRPIAHIDALGRITTTVYDQVVSGNPVDVEIDALGRYATTVYDSVGRVIAEIDVLGNRTSYTYDAVGNLHSVQNAEGYYTTFGYDANGRRTAVTDGNNHTYTTVYDERGLVSATYDPLGYQTTYGYDDNGDLVYRRDARGVDTYYARDSLGLVHRVDYSTGKTVTYTYDWSDRLQARIDDTGVTTYGYDIASQLTQVNNPDGETVSYLLDGLGHRYRMQDPNSGLTLYQYNSRALLTNIANPFDELTTIAYDALGRENYRQMANGVITEREWDVLGREWKLQHRLGSTLLARYTMTYDQTGTQLRQRVEELDGSIVTYLYDRTYQLINEHRSGTNPYQNSYTYDGAGNRRTQTENGVTTTYTYDAANRLSTATTPTKVTTYTYDQNGNLASENTGGAITTYAWDEENRLASITLPDASTEEYVYSADGMRHSKQNAASTTRYLRDGQNLLLESTTFTDQPVEFNFQSHYTDYPGAWGGLVSQNTTPHRVIPKQAQFNAVGFGTHAFNGSSLEDLPALSRFYGFDQSGHTRQLTNEYGALADSYTYSAFGENIATIETSPVPNPFRYGGETGYYRDTNDRLYVRARYLSTGAGKWLSSDPIGFEGGDWNLYRYVGNNSVNGIDASGKYVVLIRGGAGHDRNAPDPMPNLRRYLIDTYQEDVFTPTYYNTFSRWRNQYGEVTDGNSPGDTARARKAAREGSILDNPVPYQPSEVDIVDVLRQIWRHLDNVRKSGGKYRSSDPKNIYIYGHSYGGYVASMIFNPPVGTKGRAIRLWKRRITQTFGVNFKRHVVAVGNIKDYPSVFSKIDANLYTLAGDRLLPSWYQTETFGMRDWWFNPEHYQSRGLKLAVGRRGLSSVPLRSQPYWYSGGKDFVAQLPIVEPIKSGYNPTDGTYTFIPSGYEKHQYFNHVSFDARQGLSASPSRQEIQAIYAQYGRVKIRVPYRDYMIRFIANRLMAGHPFRNN